MSNQPERRHHSMGSYPGAVPEIGVWLWGMQEVRAGLLDALNRVEQAGFGQWFLEWRGLDGDDNSVASLAYHVAHIEMDWLYSDMLMTPYPDDILELVPLGARDEQGRLPHITGLGFSELRERLNRTRQRFLDVVSGLTLEEWGRVREPAGEDYAVTPAWIVFHLLEHESGHYFEIRRMARKWLEARPV